MTRDELEIENALLKLENQRMLDLFESFNRSTRDILEKIRRQGPTADRIVREMRKKQAARADVGSKEAAQMDMRTMQGAETK